MDAYKPYLDYLLAGGVAETAYILTHQGAILATNLPIKALPQYNFSLEDQKDPNVKHNIVVDERVILLEAIANKGVPKSKAGIRLYNQKYYLVRFSDDNNVKLFYLKKEHGGACVCVTNKLVLIGTFNAQLKMQNGVPQNPGELNKRVEALGQNMIKSGY